MEKLQLMASRPGQITGLLGECRHGQEGDTLPSKAQWWLECGVESPSEVARTMQDWRIRVRQTSRSCLRQGRSCPSELAKHNGNKYSGGRYLARWFRRGTCSMYWNAWPFTLDALNCSSSNCSGLILDFFPSLVIFQKLQYFNIVIYVLC